MSDKITLFKVAGHNGWRCQKQLNKRRFFKDFLGSKSKCYEQAKDWWEDIKDKYRNHWDGTLSWAAFKEKWNEWALLSSPAKQALSKKSIEKYNWVFCTIERIVHPKYLRDISLQKLRLCRTVLEEEARTKGKDNHSVNHFVSCMRAAMAWAIDHGYMSDMDITSFHKLPTAKVEVKTNTITEIELLLKYGTIKERIVVLLGFDCGCRPEEMCNMLVEKLDLDNRFALISPNTRDDKKGIRAWTPKCGKNRPIRLTQRLVDLIRRFNPKGPYLLTNQYGEAYTNGGFCVFYRKFVKKVNSEIRRNEKENPIRITGTCKTLRKDYCTSRQEQGAPKKIVSLSMGHSDTEVITKHYTNQETAALVSLEYKRLLELDKYEVPLNLPATESATSSDGD